MRNVDTHERQSGPTLIATRLQAFRFEELAWLMLFAAVGTLFTLTEAPIALRVIFGIPMVLFIPGYAVVCALFPSTDALDGVERVAVSFALSAALVPLIALGIEYSPWSLTVAPIVGGLNLVTIAGAIVAAGRRGSLAPDLRYSLRFRRPSLTPPGNWHRSTRFLTDALFVCLLVLLASGGTLLADRLRVEGTTEFALYNSAGEAQFYPRDIAVSIGDTVQIEIKNREAEHTVYRLVVAAEGQQLVRVDNIHVKNGDTWSEPISVAPPSYGDNIPIMFYLYREGDPDQTPYRILRLTVSGDEPSPGI